MNFTHLFYLSWLIALGLLPGCTGEKFYSVFNSCADTDSKKILSNDVAQLEAWLGTKLGHCTINPDSEPSIFTQDGGKAFTLFCLDLAEKPRNIGAKRMVYVQDVKVCKKIADKMESSSIEIPKEHLGFEWYDSTFCEPKKAEFIYKLLLPYARFVNNTRECAVRHLKNEAVDSSRKITSDALKIVCQVIPLNTTDLESGNNPPPQLGQKIELEQDLYFKSKEACLKNSDYIM